MAKDRYQISLWEDIVSDEFNSDVDDLYAVTLSQNLSVEVKAFSGANTTIDSGSTILVSYSFIEGLKNHSTNDGDIYLEFIYAASYNGSSTPKTATNARKYVSSSKVHWNIASPSAQYVTFTYNSSALMQVSLNEASFDDYQVKFKGPEFEHFEESKLCDIGADDMTSTCRAYEPQLVENINGTNTFKFKMYYVYRDDGGEGELLQNPFLNLLVNERRVKVLWKDKWYDFVIKDIAEDSSGKSITYTCTDLFINELSKNGFNIEFDTELENNQGTAIELARATLEGTDWQLDEVNSEVIQQEVEEPVYEVTTLANWTFFDQVSKTNVTIPANSLVLIYYNQIQPLIQQIESDTDPGFGYTPLQLAYSADGYTTDSRTSMLVVNAHCCKSPSSVYWEIQDPYHPNIIVFGNGKAKLTYSAGVSDRYRANRLVESQQTILDPLTDKYVKIYQANANGQNEYKNMYSTNDIIYGYQETEYKDPTYVNNLLVNSSNFAGMEGWVNTGDTDHPLDWVLYPLYTKSNDLTTYEAKSYLRLGTGKPSNYYIYNDGIHSSISYLQKGLVNGEYYIFRYKAMRGNDIAPNGTYYTASNHILDLVIYESNDEKQPVNSAYFTNVTYKSVGDNWIEARMQCKRSASRTDILSNKVSTFIAMRGNTIGSAYVWLEEAQFFPEVYGDVNGTRTRINPGEMHVQSIDNVVNKFYNHTKNSTLIDASKLKYIYSGSATSLPNVDPVMHEDCVKIRSINIKQSNRFNILQTIAETFECWMRFDIQHEQGTGRIVYVDGVPQKKVTIKKEIGQETGIGFIYGLDLKTIQRAIKSSDIVTKTIVSPNNNEYATDGFCTIARSEENYPRDTFVLDFGYYISHGLLNGNLLNRDLYLSTGMGYYYNLNRLNLTYDAQIEWLSNKKTELNKQQSYETVYNEYLTALQTEKGALESDIMSLSNAGTMSAATAYAKKNPDYEDLNNKIKARAVCINNIATYQKMLTQLRQSIAALESDIEDKEKSQKAIVEQLKELHANFYQKYSRYIQEGSWTSEEYIDDNLYYLDAKSVAYTSSRPQVSYNISVFRVSAIDEFKGRVFKLGDITFIQDTEFFGYVYINNVKTPYKEKVLVSEVTSYFDSPEKDTFKVQNYKTQFEDLFQRITATTQSLQYASGEYARAASIVETDGTIKVQTLQASIALNNQLVYSARNQSIVQDSTGITVTDELNPSNRTKITSGGVLITTDGGLNWVSAITGGHISTDLLTSGGIDTSKIVIQDGKNQSFLWDSRGISAFANYAGTSELDATTYTRFDKYGIYGISGIEGFAPEDEAEVWNNAIFALTWRGFMLNNVEGNGRTTITSDNDIQVFGPPAPDSVSTEEIERIKIGRLYTSDSRTGYTLDQSAVPSATPNPEITYYIYDDDSGRYLKDGLRYFTSGTLYFEGATNKVLTNDLVPVVGKTYYVPNHWAPATLPRQFTEDTIYYERSGDTYFQTGDTEPISTKTYYIKEDPQFYEPIDYLTEFEPGVEYWEWDENLNDYVVTSDEQPIEGKIYYLNVNPDPVYITADLERYFEDGVPYFIFDAETSQYVLVTEVTPDPEKLNQYAYADNYLTKVVGGDNDGFPQEFQDKEYYTRDEIVYGIRISDANGVPVMEQNGDGDLWMTGALHISNTYRQNTPVRYDDYDIRLGYLDADGGEVYYQKVSEEHVIADKEYYIFDENTGSYVSVAEPVDEDIDEYYEQINLHQIFNVNNGNFKVYENGTVYALNGHFSGDIDAHSGMFGTKNEDGTGNYVIADENGLRAYNGGLAVYKQEMFYKPLTDLEEFETGVIYYELVNDDYVVTEDATPQPGKTYYIYQEEQLVFGYDPNSGYLTVAGGATLTGAIEATSGSFSGNIYAAGGQIGGFIISHEYDAGADNWIDSLKSVQGIYQLTTDTAVVPGKTYYQQVDETYQAVVVDPSVNPQAAGYFEVYANVQLYGHDGTIVTNSLHMGTVPGADVEITLGNARLYNPENRPDDNCFIEIVSKQEVEDLVTFEPGIVYYELVDDEYIVTSDQVPQIGKTYYTDEQVVALTDQAILRLGSININGLDSILYLGDPSSDSYIKLDGNQQIIASGSNPNAQNYFYISNEGAAFNNVNVSGKITTSVFEIGKIQTVGGAFLFKPSYKLIKTEDNISSYYAFTNDTTIVSGKTYYKYNTTTRVYDVIDNPANARYQITTDITVNVDKDYYELVDDQYVLVADKTVPRYHLTEDTVVDPSQTYYVLEGGEYIEVEPDPDDNPFEEGWYVYSTPAYLHWYECLTPASAGWYELVTLNTVSGHYMRLTLDDDPENMNVLEQNGYVQVIDSQKNVDPSALFKVVYVSVQTTQVILRVVKGALASGEPFGIIYLGKDYPMLIGVNSSNSSLAYLPSRGITLSEFLVDENDYSTTTLTKAFIGDLGALREHVASLPESPGYGLYSDNVFLMGMLATSQFNVSTTNWVYAGVNTLSGLDYAGPGGDHNNDPDSERTEYGKIVFWGGAGLNSDNEIDIQHSNFVVTDEGYMYARDGYFTGSIWVEGDIYGADIYAARIHGDHGDHQLANYTGYNDYGLGIFDTQEGIIFGQNWVSDSSYLVDYKLTNTGLYTSNDIGSVPVLTINNARTSDLAVNIYGTLNTSTEGSHYRVGHNGLQYGDISNNSYNIIGSISMSNDDITLNYNNLNQVQIQSTVTKFINEIDYGDNFQYKPASGGYDLYVTAAVTSGT